MPKTNYSRKLKIAVLNLMQAMGSAASHLASNAKLRVAEINLESRRHELLTEFSLQAFEMWHNGVKLPEDLSAMFTEISEIDDRLSLLRAQKYAKVKADTDEAGNEAPAEAEQTPPVCIPANAPSQADAQTPASSEKPKKQR